MISKRKLLKSTHKNLLRLAKSMGIPTERNSDHDELASRVHSVMCFQDLVKPVVHREAYESVWDGIPFTE